MPRLGNYTTDLFDENGRFVGVEGLPFFKDIKVSNLVLKDAVAYRTIRHRNEKRNSYFYQTVKEPTIVLQHKEEILFIVDRRVLWDLIRNFDPQIGYRHFLEMLEYFSVFQILKDYLHDYADTAIGIWYHKSSSGKIITAIQLDEAPKETKHEEIIQYLDQHLEYDFTQSFFRVGKTSNYNVGVPKRHRSLYLQVIKDDMILEIKQVVTRGLTFIRVFKELEDGMVQMIPRIQFKKNLEFIDAERLYDKIQQAIDVMQTDFEYRKPAQEIRPRGKMTNDEWDAIQYQWFVNSFSKVGE